MAYYSGTLCYTMLHYIVLGRRERRAGAVEGLRTYIYSFVYIYIYTLYIYIYIYCLTGSTMLAKQAQTKKTWYSVTSGSNIHSYIHTFIHEHNTKHS